MAFGFSEFSGPASRCRSAGRTSRSTSPTPGRSAPRVTLDFGVRYSQLLQLRTPTTTARPSFDPGARSTRPWATIPATACCSLPGTNFCRDAGLRRAAPRHRTARCTPQDVNAVAPRLSASPGTSTATARPPSAPASASSTCASASALASASPATRRSAPAHRHPHPRQHAEPCAGCFGVSRARPPAAASSARRPPTTGSGTSASSTRSCRNTARAELRRQQGQEPAADPRHQPGGRRRQQRQRHRRPAVECGAPATAERQCGPSAVVRQRPHHLLGPQRQLDLPLAADPAREPLRPRLAVPGLLHLVAHDRQRAAGRQRPTATCRRP